MSWDILADLGTSPDPFALFENTKAGDAVLLWEPARAISAIDRPSLERAFEALDEESARGRFCGGYLTYEAGWHFGGAPRRSAASASNEEELPLLSFYAFERRKALDARGVRELLGYDFPACAIHSLVLSEDEATYRCKVERIRAYLHAGDTYQVNHTLRCRFLYEGTPLALYSALREQQRVEHGAYLHFPEARILSLSPELFLAKEGDRLTAKPMKGTAMRGSDPGEDAAIVAGLRRDPKAIAENVMIVDLLRSDIGSVAKAGSVRVPSAFEVQTFETVHQLVSTVEGSIDPAAKPGELFEHLYPCGSITGAPKRRTMEIIAELEDGPRGVYTGAIGTIDPNRDFRFNVAIRTVVSRQDGIGELGIGSGIVADSVADDEYAECLLKARFLTNVNDSFQLIESMRLDEGKTEPDHLVLHLDRLERSARTFRFAFFRERTAAAVREAVGSAPAGTCKVRLLLFASGAISITLVPLFKPESGPKWMVVSAVRIRSRSIFQRHKTTQRHHYDAEHEAASNQGAYDVLFLNERDEVAETARHNVFIESRGSWLTPPLDAGVLDGVQRRILLGDPERTAREQRLTLDDVRRADRIYLTNSVRGVVEVKLRT